MSIAIIGQQAFAKSVFEAFRARGDEVAGVFCAPWTGLEAHKHIARRFADVAGKPGEITSIGAEGVIVAVQGGSVALLKVRVEGGEKSSAAEFCTTVGLAEGDRLNAPTAPAQPVARHAKEPESA